MSFSSSHPAGDEQTATKKISPKTTTSDGSHKLDKKHVVHEQHSSTTELTRANHEALKNSEDGAVSVKQVV